MLFNSYIYIFVFLPVVVMGFGFLSLLKNRTPLLLWLTACSLFFYSWWHPGNLPLLLFSMAANYTIGHLLSRKPGKPLLVLGLAINLGLLAYYKYTGFFLANLADAGLFSGEAPKLILPLAISFFTFIQIAYLVDAWRGKSPAYGLLDYVLFVTFFPHLIAGPIVHHHELIPQFRKPQWRLRWDDLSAGLVLFVIGLFKKTVIADSIARYATPVFAAAHGGADLSFQEAWTGALAYTFQIYFDFSGYSDMAIGAARMMGVWLPLNFNAPYQSTSPTEFWRRWHMSLSRFLRDYLYIPLGGNRQGSARRHINLMLTMLLGGLWHGAGWTFVAWGCLHGLYLVVNHLVRARRGESAGPPPSWHGWLGRLGTFLAVVIAWVFFRAQDFDTAWTMLKSMAGMSGFHGYGAMLGLWPGERWIIFWLPGLLAMVWFLPPSQSFLKDHSHELSQSVDTPPIQFRPHPGWAALTAVLLIASVFHMARHTSEFLYFQF